MTLEDARIAITERFDALWDQDDAEASFEGEPFTPKREDGEEEPWIRIFVRHQAAKQRTMASIGFRKFKNVGVIAAEIYTGRAKGTRLSDQLADKVSAIFQGESFGGVRCYASTKREGGTIGSYLLMNVSTAFDYDEIK